MARWKSNGDNYSPNEEKLLGALVKLTQGNNVWIGTLKYVPAQTRGNTTIAVVGKHTTPSGRVTRVRQPLWELRRKPFTIEPATAEEVKA